MKNTAFQSQARLTTFILLLSALAISCGKKETVQAPPEPAPAAAEPAVAAQAPQAARPTTPQPVEDNSSVKTRIAEAQAAMKAKNYDKAAAAVSMPRGTPAAMTGQQLLNYNNTRAAVVDQLIAAAAAGDAKAKATLDLMRQRSMENR